MMKVLLAAALAGVVKAQSQCSADYLSQINTLCCTDDRGQDMCHGGQPTRCNGNCATMYLVRAAGRRAAPLRLRCAHGSLSVAAWALFCAQPMEAAAAWLFGSRASRLRRPHRRHRSRARAPRSARDAYPWLAVGPTRDGAQDFYDNCDTTGLPPAMDTLATTCRSTVSPSRDLFRAQPFVISHARAQRLTAPHVPAPVACSSTAALLALPTAPIRLPASLSWTTSPAASRRAWPASVARV